jgi:hypothetical protein
MALTVDHIQRRLKQFELDALFFEDLGWAAAAESFAAQLSGDFFAHNSRLQGRVIAQVQGVTALEITGLLNKADFALDRLYPCLNQIANLVSDPLVIWTDSNRQRSLWCWLGDIDGAKYWHTHVVIRGQGDWDWAMRLARLQHFTKAETFADCLDPPLRIVGPEIRSGFCQSWQGLVAGLQGIPTMAERQHYALRILLRMIVVGALQQRGFLAEDPWFLQNQFGKSQQQGQNRFFANVWQPLCQQGFSLPYEERTLPVQQQLGMIPFLPTGPFQPDELDQCWGHLPIPDTGFEPALSWLGDVLMAAAEGPGLTDILQPVLEWVASDYWGEPMTTPSPVIEALCDRTLNSTILDRATALEGDDYPSIPAMLMSISPIAASALLEEIGQMTILDPACGAGRYLVTTLRSLARIICTLTGIVALRKKVPLPPWLSPGTSGPTREERSATDPGGRPSFNIIRHLLSRSWYGLDQWPLALEMTRLQLFLEGVHYANEAQEIASLPDLSLTILEGNALVGLVRVDSERFDQIQPRSKRAPTTSSTTELTPLQGNLLQPLMAETYQSILAERQVRLEHYRSQTELLAEAGNVPAYAQADFLRDRLDELNQIAQDKLNHLLWNECSQQFGIRLQHQDESGKRQFRLLEPADIELVKPFHWGFYFNQLLRERGGFDLIVSHFPTGVVQPTATEFVATHQDLFHQKTITPSTFRHNASQILTIDPDLNRAWLDYRSTFSFPNQYFRRSEYYPHASLTNPVSAQSRLYWSRLYLERSLELLRPGGHCGGLMEPFWSRNNSQALRDWLQNETALKLVLDLSNHAGLWGEVSSRTTLSLLWLQKGGCTEGNPHVAYQRATDAITPAKLHPLLQRLIDLNEKPGPIS